MLKCDRSGSRVRIVCDGCRRVVRRAWLVRNPVPGMTEPRNLTLCKACRGLVRR